MRVISGKYRGKKLLCQDGLNTRPTTDRVKEALFGSIQFDVPGAKVLDLFAGSGGLGIECLSRGAVSCDFIENDRNALEVLLQNLSQIDNDYQVYERDYMVCLKELCNNTYDLIFMDPPYSANYYTLAIKFIFDNDMLAKDGIIIVESDTDKKVKIDELFNLKKEKRYGNTTIQFFVKGND